MRNCHGSLDLKMWCLWRITMADRTPFCSRFKARYIKENSKILRIRNHLDSKMAHAAESNDRN